MSNEEVAVTRQPPEGFVLIRTGDGFNSVIMPAYVQFHDHGVNFGFFVEKKHCNPMGTCHGGMLMTFVDVMLGGTLCRKFGKFVNVPTLNLSCDFVSSPIVGDWLYSELHSLHMTRSVGYVSGAIIGPKGLVVRASGSFKLPKEIQPPGNITC